MLDGVIYSINRELSIEEVKKEIDLLPDINYKDANDLSLMHWFTKLKDVSIILIEETIDYLLSKNMDIDISNRRGETALVYACQYDREDMVVLFVKKGANVNIHDQMNDSPLLWACYNRNLSMTKFLVENGADIYHQYMDKRNALMWASRRGDPNIVRYLLQFTTEINTVDKFGNTAYDLSSNSETDAVFLEWSIENKLKMLSYFKNMENNHLYEKQLIRTIFSYYTVPFMKREHPIKQSEPISEYHLFNEDDDESNEVRISLNTL